MTYRHIVTIDNFVLLFYSLSKIQKIKYKKKNQNLFEKKAKFLIVTHWTIDCGSRSFSLLTLPLYWRVSFGQRRRGTYPHPSWMQRALFFFPFFATVWACATSVRLSRPNTTHTRTHSNKHIDAVRFARVFSRHPADGYAPVGVGYEIKETCQ